MFGRLARFAAFPSFEPVTPRLRIVPRLDLLRDLLLTIILLLLAISLFSSPARAQAVSTIFLTDRNGQISFPFSPPNRATGGPGKIENMTIGATTPQDIFAKSLTGPSAATAPSFIVLGGTSSTSGSQGGSARLHGGLPGATGVGGDATVRGAVGGTTSGAGGLASLTGGAGTAGNSAGGLARAVGGAGQGSAAGGAAQVTGGVGGATGAGGAAAVTAGAGGATSGAGGVATVTGGAGSGGNANGGDVNITGGAANGSGVNGVVRENGIVLRQQGTPGTLNSTGTLTAALMDSGIVTTTSAAAVAATIDVATNLDTALPTSIAGDAFDFSIINTGPNTLTVGTASGWTLVGTMTVVTNVSGRFRARKTGTGTWTLYRLS